MIQEKEAYKKWLKTEAGKQHQAQNLRYKRAALAIMRHDSICDILYDIQEECDRLEWAIMEDDDLLNAIDDYDDDRSEFRFAFSELSVDCERLYEALQCNEVTEHFDDFLVGTVGNKYTPIGYDDYENDYFHLTKYDERLAQEESCKRLVRLTKSDLISVAGQCIGVMMAVLDIRSKFDSLNAAISLLKGERLQLLQDIENVETAYEKAAHEYFIGEQTKKLDDIAVRLPVEVWVL